jgi:hypothetical protein
MLPDECVDGVVSPEAMDADGTSVYRRLYCKTPDLAVAQAAKEGRAAETRVAYITPSTLPPPYETDGGKRWEFFAIDKPTDDCDAHAEIQFRHEGSQEPQRVKKPSARTRIKAILATAFTVCPT